jgi:L,D-transpeptidase ErfK/SrfK
MAMRKLIALLIAVLTLIPASAFARYGERLCGSQYFYCIKIHGGQSWYSLWPNARQRDVVQRLNRMNTPLRPGMVISVPKNINGVDSSDIAPFASHISAPGRRTVIVSTGALAWGAYDENGRLINWGPASGGKSWCADVKRGCRTPKGSFIVYEKRGPGCFSTKFPVGKGGAPMPYCMFFRGGFALHGSPQVPGYNASHGCVRLFVDDARWLNQEFVRSGGTRVIVVS